MSLKKELLSQMTDEELASTIQSIRTMINSGGFPNPKGAVSLLLDEVVKRKETTNEVLIEFQDLIVNSFLKETDNE
jgi:hypothetical protein